MIIGAVIGSLVLLILFFRTNVSLAIMGLCAGYVFSDLLSDELVDFVYSQKYDQGSLPIASVVSIGLILLPALLILFRFKGHQSGRLLQHFVPAIGFALLATLLIFTNVPIETERFLRDESVIFQQLTSAEIVVASAVVGIAVVDVILHESEHRRRYSKRHRRKE